MKGKNGRRLALHRETLKQLDPRQLEGAHGAATYTCVPSTRPICCTASDSCPPPPTGDCTWD
jgi:hypothetical protein